MQAGFLMETVFFLDAIAFWIVLYSVNWMVIDIHQILTCNPQPYSVRCVFKALYKTFHNFDLYCYIYFIIHTGIWIISVAYLKEFRTTK